MNQEVSWQGYFMMQTTYQNDMDRQVYTLIKMNPTDAALLLPDINLKVRYIHRMDHKITAELDTLEGQ